MEFRIQGQEFIDHVNVHTYSFCTGAYVDMYVCITSNLKTGACFQQQPNIPATLYPSVINVILINADHVC